MAEPAVDNPMKAHRIDTKVAEDGSITMRNLPFQAGEEVEVIILLRPAETPNAGHEGSLHGSVRNYERPFESATDAEEWEAA